MVKITIGNRYIGAPIEEYNTSLPDLSDPEQNDVLVADAINYYLEEHKDARRMNCPDVDYDTLVEGCFYMLEEVPDESI